MADGTLPVKNSNIYLSIYLSIYLPSVSFECSTGNSYNTSPTMYDLITQVSGVFKPVERITCYYGNQGDCGKRIELHLSTLVPGPNL